MSASTPHGVPCDCCKKPVPVQYTHDYLRGRWVCLDCLKEMVPTVVITDDEAGTEWTIYE